MSKIRIKIANEVVDSTKHRLVSGVSGKEYLFMADAGQQAYVYDPKELPFELEDIFGVVAMPFFPWRFVPMIVDGDQPTAAAPVKIAPFVTPDKYEGHSTPELLALCADCGFTARQRHDPDMLKAQLDAYFVGRAVGEKAVRSSGVGATDKVTPPPAPPQKETQRAPKPKGQSVLEV